jgi:sugar lactone lactonase YvrE
MKDQQYATRATGRTPSGQRRKKKPFHLITLCAFALAFVCGLMAWRAVSADGQLNVSTIAGSSDAGTIDFQNARGIALAPTSALLYVADTSNHVIRMVDTTTTPPTVTIIAGQLGVAASDPAAANGDGGLASAALLKNPSDLALDSNGDLYIADTGNHRIRKLTAVGGLLTPASAISTVAGNGTAGSADGSATGPALAGPRGLALDGAGSIYIADTGNHRVKKVTGSIIQTIAGNGFQGDEGDGSLATSCSLNAPLDVVVDSSSNVYIADTGNHRVRVINGANINAFAGTGTAGFNGDGTATAAHLNSPSGLAIDGASRIYIADTGNHRIRQVASGDLSTVAGNASQGYDGDGLPVLSHSLNLPSSVAANSAGTTIFFMDTGNRRLRRVSSGVLSTVVSDGSDGYAGDGGPATSARLNLPHGVAVDAAGDLYLADTNNHAVRKIAASDGKITTLAGNGAPGESGDNGPAANALLNRPTAVVVDDTGAIYVADTGNHRVRRIDSAGNISTVVGVVMVGGVPTTIGAALSNPRGLAADSDGGIYIADTGNNMIRRLGPGGIVTTMAGTGAVGSTGDGGPANAARLNQPHGITIDAANNLYIADTNNHRIRKISSGGSALVPTSTISTIVSAGLIRSGFDGDGGLATSARLNSPSAVAVDAQGNIYIVDKGNHRIRKVTISDNKINTVIGNGLVSFGGDGGPATSAAFNLPNSLAINAAGVYVADSGNNRIRLAAPPPNAAPALANPGNKVVNEGDTLSFTLSATDTPGQTLTYSMTGAPAGATLNSATGAFSYTPDFNAVPHSPGVPAAPVQLTITFKATDNAATPLEDAETMTLTVNDVNRTPTADAGTTPATLEATGPAGAALSLNGSGSDPDGDPLTFTWIDTVGSTASTIATTATANVTLGAGTHSLILTASDDRGGVKSAAAKTVVVQDTTPPVLANVPADVTQTISSGTGATVNYTMPTATDAVNGAVTVTASKASGSFFNLGATTVTFTATDSRGNTATASFKVTINLVNGSTGSTIYNIDAFAGQGSFGLSGDAGAALQASFKQPHGVAVDAAGNVYISDAEARAVRKVNASDGKISLFAGAGAKGSSGDGGPATSAKLNHPTGLAVDGAGNLYIADTNNHRIRKVTGTTITTVAGSGVAGFGGDGGGATSAQLNYPTAVAVDNAGNLYIADSGNHRIRKVTGVRISTVAGSGATGFDDDGVSAIAASLDNPTGLAVSGDGNTLYIADQGNHRIRKVAGETITTVAGNGSAGFSGDAGDAASASLNAPTSVALDALGNLIIVDSGNDRIRKVNASDNKINTIVGTIAAGNIGDGGAGASAMLDTPVAIALNSSSGEFFFTDAGNLRVRKLTPVETGPPNNSPVPAPLANQSLNKNQLLDVALSATDADGDPVTFSVVSGAPLPFLSIINANPAARTATLHIAPNNGNAGVYNLKIQAADDKGGTAQTATFTITVNDIGGGPTNAPPTAIANALAATIEASGPAGVTVNLNGSASTDPDGDPLSYQWTDNGTVFATTSTTSRALSLGPHTIMLTVNDGQGNSNTTSQTVLVRDTTPPTITVPTNAVSFIQGDPVVLPTPTASDTVDTSVAVTSNAPASFPLGTTVVTFTATDDAGNSATATVNVTINAAGGPSAPTVTSMSPTAGTQGQTLTVTINGANFAPGAQVSFSGGDITAVVNSNTGTVITATVNIGLNATPGSSSLNRRSVTVTNPGVGSATLTRIFAVNKR